VQRIEGSWHCGHAHPNISPHRSLGASYVRRRSVVVIVDYHANRMAVGATVEGTVLALCR
jgi:hypothetical protein